jgi:hypothetical protein
VERNERGAVTAEAAVVIPTLALLTLALAWFVTLGVTQVRVTDAARETARALARGDSDASGLALGRRVAPDGSRFHLRREAGTVVVRVTTPVRSPLAVLSFLPEREVSAEAVARAEGR